MSTLSGIARSSARGSLFLFLGQFASTVIMAVASILIARFLGPEEYGIYTIAFAVPSMLVTLSDFGLSPALTRFSAYYHAKGDDRKLVNLIKAGILFKLAFSIILSLCMLLLAEQIAAHILNRPIIGPLLYVASLYLVGDAVLRSLESIFIGLNKMEISSLLVNIQAVTKTAVSPVLVIIGLGVFGALLGAGLGFVLAAAIGIFVLLLRTCPELERNSLQSDSVSFFQGFRKMISYGTPLYFSVILGTILLQFRTIILSFFASNNDIGNYAISMNFTVLISLLTYPLSTSLFPAFSKLDIEKDRNVIEKMFKLAVKYTSLIVIPASLALAVLSSDAIYTIYGSQFKTAPSYLSLYAISFLYAGIGTFVMGPLIEGQGHTKTQLKITIVGVILSFLLLPVLIPLYGVPGLILSILISSLISTSYALYIVHRKFRLNIEPICTLKILATSLLSALLAYIFPKLITSTNPIYSLALGGILYITSFLAFAPVIGAVNDEDIENLEFATNDIPLIRIPALYILKVEKKILELKRSFGMRQ